jgi:hypothetical protein
MSLRDTFRDDVRLIFENPEELAAAHTITLYPKNSRALTMVVNCVLDEEITTPGNIGKFEGINKLGKIMFIRENILPINPVPGARMDVDGVWYVITYIEPDNLGMTEIHLERRQT